jgi:uncharacterized membrane protein YbhN (UPF0104 family)
VSQDNEAEASTPAVGKGTPLVRYGKLLLKAAVTALLIWLVFRKVDFKETVRIFSDSKPGWLIASLFVYFGSLLLSTQRSMLFLGDVGIRLGYPANLRLYLQGGIYNIVLPGGIGGDGYKILVLNRSTGTPYRRILTAFLLERISGLWAICFWLTVLGFFVPLPIIGPWQLAAAFAAGTIAYRFVVHRFFHDHAVGFVRKHLVSIGVQACVMGGVSCLLLSQGVWRGQPPYLFAFQSSTILSVLNIGLSGLGIREFAMSYASDVLKTSASLSVFVASSFWLLSLVAVLPGLYFLYRDDPASKPSFGDPAP